MGRLFNEAQAITPFRLRQPGYLPTGYAFLDAMVAPSPDDRAFLFYSGPDGEIVLIQESEYLFSVHFYILRVAF